MKAAPNWYIDPDDSTQERYWNGSMWQRERRPLRAGSRAIDDDSASPAESTAAPVVTRDSTAHTNELLAAVLVETRRTANYLAIITYITVALLVLGVVGSAIAVFVAQGS